MLNNVRKWWRNKKAVRSAPKPRPRTVPRLESLEDRSVPAPIVVNTLAGTGNPAMGIIALRDAIAQANQAGGNQEIDFQAGLAGTIFLQSALPHLTANITIVGGQSLAVQRDTNAATTFNIFTVDKGSTSSISSLAIMGGVADGVGSTHGGGVQNGGTLTLTNDNIQGNTASGTAQGGGICNFVGATLYVSGCRISGNQANGIRLGGGHL